MLSYATSWRLQGSILGPILNSIRTVDIPKKNIAYHFAILTIDLNPKYLPKDAKNHFDLMYIWMVHALANKK